MSILLNNKNTYTAIIAVVNPLTIAQHRIWAESGFLCKTATKLWNPMKPAFAAMNRVWIFQAP